MTEINKIPSSSVLDLISEMVLKSPVITLVHSSKSQLLSTPQTPFSKAPAKEFGFLFQNLDALLVISLF